MHGSLSAAAAYGSLSAEGRIPTLPTLNTSSTGSSGCSQSNIFGEHFNKCCNGKGHMKASVFLPETVSRRKHFHLFVVLVTTRDF